MDADLFLDVQQLTKELIRRPSISPEDQGCQILIADLLEREGFIAEWFNQEQVSNCLISHGMGDPWFIFIGHTDVVPPGDVSAWTSPAFVPEVRDGKLFGRGVSDMKGGVAAFVCAAVSFVRNHPQHKGTLALLLTSDEEGPAQYGTRVVAEALAERGIVPEYCLVGEPSSKTSLGDEIKIGRRGSLSGYLTFQGKQGHSAYANQVINPIHLASPMIARLGDHVWDTGNEHFPPSTLQFVRIAAGAGADNVVPGNLDAVFNLRFNNETTPVRIEQEIHELLRDSPLPFELVIKVSSHPFLSKPAKLTEAVTSAIKDVCQLTPILTTTGGTSDGRFLSPSGAEIVECGLLNSSIHQVNENTPVEDLERLSRIYLLTLNKVFN